MNKTGKLCDLHMDILALPLNPLQAPLLPGPLHQGLLLLIGSCVRVGDQMNPKQPRSFASFSW